MKYLRNGQGHSPQTVSAPQSVNIELNNDAIKINVRIYVV